MAGRSMQQPQALPAERPLGQCLQGGWDPKFLGKGKNSSWEGLPEKERGTVAGLGWGVADTWWARHREFRDHPGIPELMMETKLPAVG